MDFAQTTILGALAGFTIYLGLPFGRLQNVSPKVHAFLTMVSAGILFFLLYDILHQAVGPIEDSLAEVTTGAAPVTSFLLLLFIFVVGFGIGLLGLIHFEQRIIHASGTKQLTPLRLALMIAIGLGFHNFSEGLAIGQSAGRGELAFATLLIIGFGLHNATEGFGIVGPLVGTRPSWQFLGLAGLIGGGPTFLGTLIGYRLTSVPMSILFLSLAAGTLIYIVGELFGVSRRLGLKFFTGWGLLAGFLLAYCTDLILTAAGK